MHFHYYALKQLVSALPVGEQVQACFSQTRNELILELDSFFLRIGCNTPLTYIVPVSRFARARKNVVNLFPEIVGAYVEAWEAIAFDRIVILHLSGGMRLVAKMHGSRANVMLYENHSLLQAFNQNQSESDTDDFPSGRWEQEAVALLSETVDPREILTQIRRISPIFEKQFAAKIIEEMESGLSLPESFLRVNLTAQKAPYYLVKGEKSVKFLLFEPPKGTSFLAVNDIYEALSTFLRTYFQFNRYVSQYKILAKAVQEPFKKVRKALRSCEKSIEQLERERPPEELGHILMANLHRVPEGIKEVELEDLYLGGKVNIKLNPKLSPQANAERYYEKQKAQKVRLAFLYKELEKIQVEFEKLSKDMAEFQEIAPPQALPFGPDGLDFEAIQLMKKYAKAEAPKQDKKIPPFRNFTFMNYEIFVGKNGKNNDELSFKFATKEDIWLHAKDVPGSHVVIRKKPGQTLPKPVLEHAASLAAYYSKSKHDSVVPVIYTPRKFIRKRKGDPPGMVVVNREEVILVEPLRKGEVNV